MLFPPWNAFHVSIVVIVLQYHLIPILIVLPVWMIAFIMANVGTLHAKTVLKRKKVFLVCIAGLTTNSNTLINGSTTGVTKSMKTATKHAKSKQHMSSMKYWKKLLIQEQQTLSPTDASSDNEVMNEPSLFEPSENNNIPKPFLPGQTLNSLN